MSNSFLPSMRGWAWPSACAIALVTTLSLLTAGCGTTAALQPLETAELHAGWRLPVSWLTPVVAADEAQLTRWRRAVGPPVASVEPSNPATPADRITVVSWNVATGGGNVDALLEALPQDRPLVLLLQEAFRRGPAVPTPMTPGAFFAGRLGGERCLETPPDIEALAGRHGLSVYYVPSMRNGGPASDEDRGNAILSNLPLSDLLAVELPFERQRRVAVAATVHGVDARDAPWRLRVVSAHFDNLVSVKYGWLGGEFGRARQARALREAIGADEATVLGGDFNTWFGFAEPAYVETLHAFPDTAVTDPRATFRGLLRLDHLFFRLDDGWTGRFARAENRYGSDHYPLIGTIELR